MPGVIHIPQPDTYRGIYGNSEEDQIHYAEHLEETIKKRGQYRSFSGGDNKEHRCSDPICGVLEKKCVKYVPNIMFY